MNITDLNHIEWTFYRNIILTNVKCHPYLKGVNILKVDSDRVAICSCSQHL